MPARAVSEPSSVPSEQFSASDISASDFSASDFSGAAEVPAPPWKARRKAPVTRQPLSAAAVIETALRLVDRDGLDALSMRRVPSAGSARAVRAAPARAER